MCFSLSVTVFIIIIICFCRLRFCGHTPSVFSRLRPRGHSASQISPVYELFTKFALSLSTHSLSWKKALCLTFASATCHKSSRGHNPTGRHCPPVQTLWYEKSLVVSVHTGHSVQQQRLTHFILSGLIRCVTLFCRGQGTLQPVVWCGQIHRKHTHTHTRRKLHSWPVCLKKTSESNTDKLSLLQITQVVLLPPVHPTPYQICI